MEQNAIRRPTPPGWSDTDWIKHLQDKDRTEQAIALAYGYLWHVNNEPGTPCQYPPERAAYEARKILRDLMTHEQRGEAINRVRKMMGHNAALNRTDKA